MQINAISMFQNAFGAKKNLADGRVERIVRVRNDKGLHCRPAAYIVRITGEAPDKDVFVGYASSPEEKNPITNSILGLLMLSAPKGTELVLNVPKDYPQKAYKALVKCFEARDDEDAARISERFLQ